MLDGIIANIERLNQLMDENECSAVVARSGKNFTYLACFYQVVICVRRLGSHASDVEPLSYVQSP